MTLKVKPFSVRRRVNVLKKPTPTFVSLVDHAATQTPFAVVKRGPKPATEKDDADMAFKRTNKKRTPPSVKETPAKTKKSSGVDTAASASVYKLIFQQNAFKTEKSVVAWLKKNQWSGDYAISDEDGEFIVKSKTAKSEDQFDLREVALVEDGSISALVSKVSLADSELTAKAITPKSKAKAKPAGMKTDTNAVQDADTVDEDDDGTEAAGSKVDNARSAADDDEDEDADADVDADEDDDGEDDGEDDAEDDGSDEDDDASEDDDDDIATADLTAADGEDIDGNDMEDDDGDNAEGDYNHDNDPADDDAEGAEDAAGVDDPEGYGDRSPGGHASIREKERNEPLPKDLPGQSITPTGAGKPGHEPGAPGKYRIQRRLAAGRMPIGCVDRLIRKYDSYSVYLSGGMSLKDVLEDGLSDGIPPGVSEVFQSLYKAVGNTLKSSKGEINADIKAISGEFTEAVVALHDVWKGLLKKGTKTQKAAAKKWFADIDTHGGLQTFAKTAITTSQKQAEAIKKAAKPVKKSSTLNDDAVAAIIKKALAPVQQELAKTKKELADLRKPAPARKGLGSDDLDHGVDNEAARRQREEDDDEAFIRERARKAMFGTTRG